MPPTIRNAILALLFFSVAVSSDARCEPLPQGTLQENPQGAAPPSRPAQAPVMLNPAPMGAAQVPQKEPLSADALKPDRILRVGHSGSVQALAFSPDRRWLASGGYDRSIIVWNLSSGREEFHFGGLPATIAPSSQALNKQAISSLAFNADGTRLVSVDVSGAVKVWNMQTRKMLFAIHPHRVHYYGGAVSYSPDGNFLLIPVEKRAKDATETMIGFYDAETGKSLRTIPTKWDVLWNLVPTAD